MSKIQHYLELTSAGPSAPTVAPQKEVAGKSALDKLAQPRKACLNPLQKRARAKTITLVMVHRLMKVKHTPLHNSYARTLECGSVILQADKTLTSKYCNNRWCLVCNRIRTAKMLNGYEKPLQKLKQPYLVTLTLPNVTRGKLHTTVDLMLSELQRIRDTMRKRGRPAVGIRKLEITYNREADTYHPHLHMIIEGVAIAGEVRDEWLLRFPRASDRAQDIRKAKPGAYKELFKYFTKLVMSSNGRVYFEPIPMDVIFRSMKGRRVFQPMGITKEVNEDIEELHSKEFKELDPGNYNWYWQKDVFDWVDLESGELLTGYHPNEQLQKFIAQIRAGPP